MHISDKGLDIIKEFEGYEKALPNGDCVAYRCIVGKDSEGIPVHDGKWTIGWGCTEGIVEGTIWTRAQAEEGLKREIVVKEQFVLQSLKFVPNQNQFDAMVSFVYNIGEGAFVQSTMLRKANTGDMAGAAQAFGLFNKSKGFVVGGLVRRRARESVLFMELPSDVQALPMPQTVDIPDEGITVTTQNKIETGKQVVAGGGIIATVLSMLGLVPADILTFIKTYGVHITLIGLGSLFVISEVVKNLRKDK